MPPRNEDRYRTRGIHSNWLQDRYGLEEQARRRSMQNGQARLGLHDHSIHDEESGLLITNVYFPLRSSDSPKAEVREEVLQILDMEDRKHILTGDWNAHSSAWHSHKTDERGSMIEDELDSRGNHVIHNENTFTRAATGILSSPDITMATADIASRATWHTCGVVNTDHLPSIIAMDSEIPKREKPKRVIANYRKADWKGFKTDIETRIRSYVGPRDAYSLEKLISKAILEAAGKHIPSGRFVPTRECQGDTKEIDDLLKKRAEIQKMNSLDGNIAEINDVIEKSRRAVFFLFFRFCE
uniref:Endo/exonuclease/phosphatase domain-containing protein n=1 Tax=Caenorhabditis japonica TaxID=281687 RepID=A0A8R1HKT4_CAEJA